MSNEHHSYYLNLLNDGTENADSLSSSDQPAGVAAYQWGNKKIHAPEKEFLEKAARVVEANLEDSTFNSADFAREMLMSRTHLFRKLKAIVGMSATGFVREYRLQRAAELLLTGSEPVSQIAFQVGFNHLSYFAKCFKGKFGCSPSEYKNTKY